MKITHSVKYSRSHDIRRRATMYNSTASGRNLVNNILKWHPPYKYYKIKNLRTAPGASKFYRLLFRIFHSLHNVSDVKLPYSFDDHVEVTNCEKVRSAKVPKNNQSGVWPCYSCDGSDQKWERYGLSTRSRGGVNSENTRERERIVVNTQSAVAMCLRATATGISSN